MVITSEHIVIKYALNILQLINIESKLFTLIDNFLSVYNLGGTDDNFLIWDYRVYYISEQGI